MSFSLTWKVSTFASELLFTLIFIFIFIFVFIFITIWYGSFRSHDFRVRQIDYHLLQSSGERLSTSSLDRNMVWTLCCDLHTWCHLHNASTFDKQRRPIGLHLRAMWVYLIISHLRNGIHVRKIKVHIPNIKSYIEIYGNHYAYLCLCHKYAS